MNFQKKTKCSPILLSLVILVIQVGIIVNFKKVD